MQVECPNSCGGYRLQRRELERHLRDSCPRRQLVCSSRCGASVPAEDYVKHQVLPLPTLRMGDIDASWARHAWCSGCNYRKIKIRMSA